MIRTFAILLLLTVLTPLSVNAASPPLKRAVAILKVPAFIEKADGTLAPAAALNIDLKKAGMTALPEYLEVTNDEKDAYKKMEAIEKVFEAAITKISATRKEWIDASRNNPLFPTDDETAEYATCYSGDAVAVPDAVANFAGVVFTEQLNMFGLKYKKTTQYFNSSDDAGTDVFLADGSKLWKSWKGTDDSILILSSVGDGGDDVQESLIPVCP
ncbi:hypothetical protein BH10BDE1_BH10BDE1_16120 [soil metagenome]